MSLASWKKEFPMDVRTGELYPTREAAIAAGVPGQHVVELTAKGDPRAVAGFEDLMGKVAAVIAAERKAAGE